MFVVDRQISEVSEDISPFRLTTSLAIAGFCAFVAESARGILLPAIWPICDRFNGDRILLGFLVATFSAGRVTVWRAMGKIAGKCSHRPALLLSTLLLLIGAIAWSCTPIVGGMALLFTSQFILGLGTGSLGVIRAFLIGHTEQRKRSRMLARLTALQYVGLSATPIIGSALIAAGAMASPYWEITMPAIGLACLAFVAFCALVYPFVDPQPTCTPPAFTNSIQYSTQSIVYHPIPQPRPSDMLDSEENRLSALTVSLYEDPDIASCAEEMSMPSSRNSLCEIPLDDDSNHGDVKHPAEQIMNPFVNPLAHSKTDHTSYSPSTSPFTLNAVGTHRGRLLYLYMLLNFTVRGALAVVETQVAQTLLHQYDYSPLRLGGEISIAGLAGAVQIRYFRSIWSSHFSDFELLLAGLFLLGLGQSLAVTWGPDEHDKPVWRFVLGVYLILGIAYPIANSAVVGGFTALQRTGRRSKSQERFAIAGSLARIIFPIASGFMEEYVQAGSSFGLVMVMIAVCILAVVIASPERYVARATDQPLSPGLYYVKLLLGLVALVSIPATVCAMINGTLPGL